MKRTTKYVVFDVHQATTVASVRYDSPRTRAYSGGDSGAVNTAASAPGAWRGRSHGAR